MSKKSVPADALHRKSGTHPYSPTAFRGAPIDVCYYCPVCKVGRYSTARGLALSVWVLDVWIEHHGHGLVEQFIGIVAPEPVR